MIAEVKLFGLAEKGRKQEKGNEREREGERETEMGERGIERKRESAEGRAP